MFLDVLVGNWYNFFPLDPTDQQRRFATERSSLAVSRSTTDQRFDGGATSPIRTRSATSRSSTSSLSYCQGWLARQPRLQGRRTMDGATAGASSRRSRSISLLRRDRRLGRTSNEIEFYNTPNTGHQPRPTTSRVHQRHVAASTNADVQPRACASTLQGLLSRSRA